LVVTRKKKEIKVRVTNEKLILKMLRNHSLKSTKFKVFLARLKGCRENSLFDRGEKRIETSGRPLRIYGGAEPS
jgi:hypothetical protein